MLECTAVDRLCAAEPMPDLGLLKATWLVAEKDRLAEAAEVLVVGPGVAKLEFIKHVAKHEHALEPKIVGVETVDHPTDGQLVAYARRYFRAADRMR